MESVADKAVSRSQEHVKKNGKGQPYDLSVTGPEYWSKTATSSSTSFKMLPARSFYPCNWDEKDKCIADRYAGDSSVIAMHVWAMSWVKDAQSPRKSKAKKEEQPLESEKESKPKEKDDMLKEPSEELEPSQAKQGKKSSVDMCFQIATL